MLLLVLGSAQAGPIAGPGDSGLRHDLELLADAGLIQGPIQTWPLPWPRVAASLDDVDDERIDSPYVAAALSRVRARLRLNRRGDNARYGFELRGGSDPQFVRSFDDTPRAEMESSVYVDWTGDRLAGRLEFSYALNAADDRDVRLDGSWIGAALGNWMVAAGWLDRNWGPSALGGLMVSNNARPRPGLSVQRLRTPAFQTPWLSWIGPWSFTAFVEQLESDRFSSNAYFTGMRVSAKPFQSLEIGLSRTAQFGGDRYDVGFDTVINAITGQSTSVNPLVGSPEGINSVAGADFRWRVPWINVALYGELVGEDEKSSRPFKILGHGGVTFWGGLFGGASSWRLTYEIADTKADLLGQGGFDVAYQNASFRTGYRFRGRSLGHPIDADARAHFVNFQVMSAGGHQWRLLVWEGDINRSANASNSLTPNTEEIRALDTEYQAQFSWGRMEFGGGITERTRPGFDETETHGWIGYSREFD